MKIKMLRTRSEGFPVGYAAKNALKNKLYKALRPIDGKLYRDDRWDAVGDFCRILAQNLPAELGYSLWCEDGGYRTNRDNTAKWKEYLFSIYDKEDARTVLQGTLNLSAAVTVADPFGAYDVTIQMG